ncbi:MAG: hypothetical protein JWN04_1254, partial [Myxococcaceae bacterium]|nr:hypothetical protein [Myxococcaceae bacterium]
MKTPTCDRSWQVEAARDGRLDPSARAAMEAHSTGCTVCQAEQRAL